MSSVILCPVEQWAIHAKPHQQGHQCMFLSSAKATSDPELRHSRSHGTTRYITRHLLPWLYCNSALAGLPASCRRLCNEYKMPLLDLCSTLTGSCSSLQHYSSCTGCPSNTASSSRSRRWCTSFYVRRIAPTWLHSTRRTLNDVNSGRHKPELQSWNGHGRNLANAPSQLVIPVYGTVFLQQSTTLIFIMRLDELWSHIYFTVFLLHNFYPFMLLTIVMHSRPFIVWLGTIKLFLTLTLTNGYKWIAYNLYPGYMYQV